MNVPELTAVPLAEILQSPHQRLLAYPDEVVSCDRISELSNLGITALYNWGPKQIQGWHCLGLGYCGLVLLVPHQDQWAALKVRRTDAPQPSFTQEASLLALANADHIGPQLRGQSSNFLLMDYVPGQPLLQWLQALQGLTKDIVQERLTQLLQQAFCLDQAGLDHGNLCCVTAHVIVTKQQPILLDFSSASTARRPANVTSLTQGLFWGTKISEWLVPQWFQPNKQQCLDCLRQYKHYPTASMFNQLLALLFV